MLFATVLASGSCEVAKRTGLWQKVKCHANPAPYPSEAFAMDKPLTRHGEDNL